MSATVIDVKSAPDVRDVVHRAVQALAEGRLVVFPTETVYGLAASALDPAATDRLAEVKGRAAGHPLALGVRSAEEAADYAPTISPLGMRLARRCWPGPVTLVLPSDHPDSLVRQLPPAVQQAVVPNGTVGLRVPAHPLILESMRLLPGPVVLSSANRSGQEDCTSGQQAAEVLGGDVDLILDDGRSQFGQPSSVVHVQGDRLTMLREGVVPVSTLQRLASFMILTVCTGNTCRSPMAELLTRKLLAEELKCGIDQLEDQGFIIMSAGISAMAGGRPAPEAVEVMASRGLDLRTHISQPLTERLVRHADLILTMTHGHRQAVVEQWPEAAGRTRLLCSDGQDVADPIGCAIDAYRRCAEQLEAALRECVKELAGQRPSVQLSSTKS
jgi:protein-tyrosine phosphatase